MEILKYCIKNGPKRWCASDLKMCIKTFLLCWSTRRATPKTPPNSGMQWSHETTRAWIWICCSLTNITVLTFNCVTVSHLTLIIDDGNTSTLAKLGLAATFITYFTKWQVMGSSHRTRSFFRKQQRSRMKTTRALFLIWRGVQERETPKRCNGERSPSCACLHREMI